MLSGLKQGRVIVRACQPGRSSRYGPAIVVRDLQMAVAEFVESVTPAAVAAVKRQGVDSLGMPGFQGRINRHRQTWAKRKRAGVSLSARFCGWRAHEMHPS